MQNQGRPLHHLCGGYLKHIAGQCHDAECDGGYQTGLAIQRIAGAQLALYVRFEHQAEYENKQRRCKEVDVEHHGLKRMIHDGKRIIRCHEVLHDEINDAADAYGEGRDM